MVGSQNSGILLLLVLQHRYPAPTIIMFNYLKELNEVRKQFVYKRLEEEPDCMQCTRCRDNKKKKEQKKKEDEKKEEKKKSGMDAYAEVYGK